jgi:hypothetical protein
MFTKILAGIVALFAAVIGVGWLGLKVPVSSFPTLTVTTPPLQSIEPPRDLPAPVQRYVEAAFGERIPLIDSAIISGKAELNFGVTIPARFRFYQQAGKAYYHHFEGGWFGLTVFNGHERYLEGKAVLDLPVAHIENDSNTDAAANQALWAESIWLPSVYFTNPQVRWEAIDDATALLVIPDATPEEWLTVHFDPETHLIREFTTRRFKESTDVERRRWTNRVIEWAEFNGVKVPTVAEVQWDDDAPWSVWHVEGVLYNVNVSARMGQFGGEVNE